MRRRWWRSLEIQARSASEGSPAEPRRAASGAVQGLVKSTLACASGLYQVALRTAALHRIPHMSQVVYVTRFIRLKCLTDSTLP